MLIVTDLDGTLLDSSHRLSARNRATLERLGERGAVRVVATGRSLWSAERVIGTDFPIDYLVFASGAGVMSWPERRLLRRHHLPRERAIEAVEILVECDLDFMLHHAVPDNHRFWFRSSGRPNPDFDKRRRRYEPFAEPWPADLPDDASLSQLIVVEAAGSESHIDVLEARLVHLHVIRTTSPLDGRSRWVEIFPRSVSKALGADWVRARHAVPESRVLAVGNDFNDIDLLEWAAAPRVVANAPVALRARYPVVRSCDQDGFSEAVAAWLADAG